jgi:hypothetical protein
MRSNDRMFNSPLEWCHRCRAWVAIDQTLAECVREHHCAPQDCPLVQFLKREREPRPELPGDPAFELR